MRGGRLMTAMQLMAAMASATDKALIEVWSRMMHAGQFRHRGKGRGSISPNFLGKTGGLSTDGKRERRRRMRQRFGAFAEQRPEWPQ